MTFISCHLLLTREIFVGIVLMTKRNAYDLRHLNQNERIINVYGKKV